MDDLARRVDGLMQTYGQLERALAVHEEKIASAKADRESIRVEVREVESTVLGAVGRAERRLQERIADVDASCKAFAREYREDRDKSRASSRTVVAAVITGSAVVLASLVGLIGSLIVLLGGG